MNHALARKVADAVLYEGYMLYPYRPSAIKNRQRWTFGILYPPAYPEVGSGTERSAMHSEFLIEMPQVADNAALHIQLRFLQLRARQVAKAPDFRSGNGQAVERQPFEPVPSLLVDGHWVESWDEGVEREVEFEMQLGPDARQKLPFRFPSGSESELLRNSAGCMLGIVTRTQHEISGHITVSSKTMRDGIAKITVDVANRSANDLANSDAGYAHVEPCDRNSALLHSLISAHTIVSSTDASFVSLLDPPESLRELVDTCVNAGNFPVLVGTAPERDMLLCSPIVLYDYPEIAPESAGDFYDGTEMDEMLTLRVMTLTDEEKEEMRRADPRVGKLLQNTEQTAREQLMKTHGTFRGLASGERNR